MQEDGVSFHLRRYVLSRSPVDLTKLSSRCDTGGWKVKMAGVYVLRSRTASDVQNPSRSRLFAGSRELIDTP